MKGSPVRVRASALGVMRAFGASPWVTPPLLLPACYPRNREWVAGRTGRCGQPPHPHSRHLRPESHTNRRRSRPRSTGFVKGSSGPRLPYSRNPRSARRVAEFFPRGDFLGIHSYGGRNPDCAGVRGSRGKKPGKVIFRKGGRKIGNPAHAGSATQRFFCHWRRGEAGFRPLSTDEPPPVPSRAVARFAAVPRAETKHPNPWRDCSACGWRNYRSRTSSPVRARVRASW